MEIIKEAWKKSKKNKEYLITYLDFYTLNGEIEAHFKSFSDYNEAKKEYFEMKKDEELGVYGDVKLIVPFDISGLVDKYGKKIQLEKV
ncbi:MAG: hypothetical protein ACTSQ8_08030 [Candidatus Helarchaeota archaeon]